VNRLRYHPFDNKLGRACNGMQGEETVNFKFGYAMNVKFWKILGRICDTDVPCHMRGVIKNTVNV
jgi:hypothetical protein